MSTHKIKDHDIAPKAESEKEGPGRTTRSKKSTFHGTTMSNESMSVTSRQPNNLQLPRPERLPSPRAVRNIMNKERKEKIVEKATAMQIKRKADAEKIKASVKASRAQMFADMKAAWAESDAAAAKKKSKKNTMLSWLKSKFTRRNSKEGKGILQRKRNKTQRRK